MLSTLASRGWERKKILTDGNDCHFRVCAQTKSSMLRTMRPFIKMQLCALHNTPLQAVVVAIPGSTKQLITKKIKIFSTKIIKKITLAIVLIN